MDIQTIRRQEKQSWPSQPTQADAEPRHALAVSFRGQIAPIFVAFGLALMIGCANAAKPAARAGVPCQKEIGIQLSVGASPGKCLGYCCHRSFQLISHSGLIDGVALSRRGCVPSTSAE